MYVNIYFRPPFKKLTDFYFLKIGKDMRQKTESNYFSLLNNNMQYKVEVAIAI